MKTLSNWNYRTGGIPLGIVYSLGQLSGGYSLNSVLNRLTSATGDRFGFTEQSVQGIKGQPHKLLMSLAIFPDSAILADCG